MDIKIQTKRVSLLIMAREDKNEFIASQSLLLLIGALMVVSFTLLINPPVHLIFGQETGQTGQQGE